jgi:transposase
MVSQDGGVPLMSKRWEGNASDTQRFQERAHALRATCQGAPRPRSLVADAKLYNEEPAAHLKKLGFITRIPGTLKLVSQVIAQALKRGMLWFNRSGHRDKRVKLGRGGVD